jgi:hypothetical protein
VILEDDELDTPNSETAAVSALVKLALILLSG